MGCMTAPLARTTFWGCGMLFAQWDKANNPYKWFRYQKHILTKNAVKSHKIYFTQRHRGAEKTKKHWKFVFSLCTLRLSFFASQKRLSAARFLAGTFLCDISFVSFACQNFKNEFWHSSHKFGFTTDYRSLRYAHNDIKGFINTSATCYAPPPYRITAK